jgi:uncharacterized membrane protein YhaH (DUF805 family)
MDSSINIFSAAGRLAPRPFVFGALAVYGLSFLSQVLLAAPVTARASVFPFLLAQIALGWAWYALHVRRLRDAGRSAGTALALTLLYALAIVLLLLVMVIAGTMAVPDTGNFASASVMTMFLILFLAGLVLGSGAAIGLFGYVFLGVLVLITLPVLIAMGFTIWLAMQPSVAAAPTLGEP